MIIYQCTYNQHNNTQTTSQFSDSTFPDRNKVNDVGGGEEGGGGREDVGASVELQPGGGVVHQRRPAGQEGEIREGRSL